MHPSSYDNMRRCRDWYAGAEVGRVVDVGSANVNGSYRDLFEGCAEYIGVDMQPGPGVDIVLDDPYALPLADESVDLVVSGQMLEHCAQFWRVFPEIARVLKPSGRLFMIAPSAGPIHRYPVDCYRFYPDAYEAMAQWSGLRLVHCWMDNLGPWRDLVGVFQKGGNGQKVTQPAPAQALVRPSFSVPLDHEAEAVGGRRDYLDILSDLHRLLAPKLYLEIGVRRGDSLKLAACPAVGVDPHPLVEPCPANVRLFNCGSDDFFFFFAKQALDAPVDLAFIDGMHLAEFVYRDFIHLEPLMSPNGAIVIDDVFPNHPLQAARTRQTRNWCGDVWRFADFLARARPDLKLTWFDSAPTGLLIVSGLKSAHPLLESRYNPVAAGFQAHPDVAVPAKYLKRTLAVSPTEENLRAAIPLAGAIPR